MKDVKSIFNGNSKSNTCEQFVCITGSECRESRVTNWRKIQYYVSQSGDWCNEISMTYQFWIYVFSFLFVLLFYSETSYLITILYNCSTPCSKVRYINSVILCSYSLSFFIYYFTARVVYLLYF